MKIFLTFISDFLNSLYLFLTGQLRLGCFNCGLPILDTALPAAFLLMLSSARSATSGMALTTTFAVSMAYFCHAYLEFLYFLLL